MRGRTACRPMRSSCRSSTRPSSRRSATGACRRSRAPRAAPARARRPSACQIATCWWRVRPPSRDARGHPMPQPRQPRPRPRPAPTVPRSVPLKPPPTSPASATVKTRSHALRVRPVLPRPTCAASLQQVRSPSHHPRFYWVNTIEPRTGRRARPRRASPVAAARARHRRATVASVRLHPAAVSAR